MGRARPVGALFRQESSQGTQGGENLSTVGFADLTAIFIIRTITDIVITVLNAPLSAGDLQQRFAVGFRVRYRRQS